MTSAKYHIVIFQKSVKGFLLISTQMWDFAIVLEFLLDILLLLLLANTQAYILMYLSQITGPELSS